MVLDIKELEGLSPLKSLLAQGYAKTTLARVAYLRIPQLKEWEKDRSFPTDTGVVRIKALDNLSKELWGMDLPYDPVALYEAHVVLLEKDGVPFGAKLSHFFEITKWKQTDMVSYAESVDSILTSQDVEEVYPSSYKVVKASDGNKSIVAVPGVKLISQSELSDQWKDYSLIK